MKASISPPHIDLIVKDNFLEACNSAEIKAQATLEDEFLCKLENLSDYQQIELLSSAMNKISDLHSYSSWKKNEVLPYFKFYSNPEELLKFYSSRIVLLQKDDIKELEEGVYNGMLYMYLHNTRAKLFRSTETYTFNDFLAGKEDSNRYDPLYEYDYVFAFKTNKEYEKIVNWKVDTVMEIIRCEVNLLIKKIQGHISSSPDVLNILENDIDLWYNELGKSTDSKSFILKLKELSFMTQYNFKEIDEKNAFSDFQSSNGQLSWGEITKNDIDTLQIKSLNPDHIPFSNTPFLYTSIQVVIYWIREVLNGKDISEPHFIPKFKELIDDIVNRAKEDALAEINKLVEAHCELQEGQIELAYRNDLDDLIKELKSYRGFVRFYYAAIRRKEGLQNLFVVTSWFDFYNSHYVEDLRRAVIINEKVEFCLYMLSCLSPDGIVDYLNDDDSTCQIYSIMPYLAVDVDLFQKGERVKDLLDLDGNFYELPDVLVVRNTQMQMKEFYSECIERFTHHLDSCQSPNLKLYMESRILQLEQMEIQSMLCDSHQFQFFTNNTYIQHFKRYLESRAKFIRNTEGLRFIPLQNPIVKEKLNNKCYSFGFKYPLKQNLPMLEKAIKNLCSEEIKLLDERSDVFDLMKVLTAKNINKDMPYIYFACDNKQLWYIIDKIKGHFTSLIIPTIAKSKLFYNKGGKLLNAGDLHNAKTKEGNVKAQDAINKALDVCSEKSVKVS